MEEDASEYQTDPESSKIQSIPSQKTKNSMRLADQIC